MPPITAAVWAMPKVLCRTVYGKFFLVEIPSNWSVADLKDLASEKENLPPGTVKLVYGARLLDDDTLIHDLHITTGTSILVHATIPRRNVPPRPRRPRRPSPKPDPTPLKPDPTPPKPDPTPLTPDPTPPKPGPTPPKPEPAPPKTSGQSKPRTPEQPSRHKPPADAAKPAPAPPAGKTRKSISDDPENFDTLVHSLVELGFDEAKCVEALRSSRYDADAAALRLFSLPPDPQPAPPPRAARGRYGEFQSVFDALTKSEKAAVERLVVAARDPALALEMYIACEKNEAAARELL
jgi:hypothetical protein